GAIYFVVYYTVFRVCITAFNLQTPGREPVESEVATVAPGTSRAATFIHALGGAANLTSVDACATRLRLTVADQHAVDEQALKRLGARATVKVSSDALQVVLGPIADQVADEIRTQLRVSTGIPAAALLAALGGRENIRGLEAVASSRLRVRVANTDAVDDDAIRALGLRGVARPGENRVHILVGPSAPEALTSLRALVRFE
ncbi:MAG: glucose PTS transporter subunit EIIB, partial [Thermoanaerobaculia bacterium]